jgi:predicted phage tail protein
MRKIYLHGELGDRFGHEFNLDVQTATEAVRALGVNFREFAGAIREGEFHVIRGDLETGIDLDEEMCVGFNLGNQPLHIVPVIAGSKNNGLMKIVLGVALIGAAFLIPGGMAAAVPFTGGMLKAGNLAMIGLAMAASGVSTMLTPEQSSEKSEESYIFSGPGNNYDQGSTLPIVYGEVITGGVMISAGIDIEQLGK